MTFGRFAILAAVAGLLATSGVALADGPAPKTSLTLNPTVLTADEESESGFLMAHLHKAGVGQSLEDAKLNIYGWIEAGYTYNHRHHDHEDPILPGPFNHEVGNHFMLNQIALRFEKIVASDKFDVGGLVEVMFGTDAGFIHSSGWGFNGNDPTDDGIPADAVADDYRAFYQFDVSQAYVDVNLPIGTGLRIRTGKFVTLLGYETVDPTENLFYSHSWLFSAVPYSQTGIMADYHVNDNLEVQLGITRGWDMTMEDNNGCAIDVLGQVAYQFNEQMNLAVNFNVGPENDNDTSHYRTTINPILTWDVTEKLSLAFEGLYIYDGGLNAGDSGITHAYGDVWGAAAYASYAVCDMCSINGRVEKYHGYSNSIGALGDSAAAVPGFTGSVPTVNVYSFTLGVTVTPLPKDPIFKNLSFRPEVRYDVSEDRIFTAHGSNFKDQLTFAADVIFKF